VDVLRDQSTGDAATRIRRFLGDAREAVARRNDRRGCFLCNAAVDQAPMDGEIQEKVLAMMKRMESAIAAALSEDVQTAQWPSKRRAPTALTLINAYLGLRVLARSGSSARELAAVILMTMEGCGLRVNNNGKST
jgi:TetR/AcrR family transcriptional repressor of nem operon